MTAPEVGAPGAEVEVGSRAQGEQQHAQSICQHDDVQARDPRKLQADYAVLLALNGGFSLHQLAGGSFLICKWDRHHHCADLAGVRAFLGRLGVQA